MKQVYPRQRSSRPFPFPREAFSFPRFGLSNLGKEKSSLRKGSQALSFSISGILVSGPTEQLFYVFSLEKYSNTCGIPCSAHNVAMNAKIEKAKYIMQQYQSGGSMGVKRKQGWLPTSSCNIMIRGVRILAPSPDILNSYLVVQLLILGLYISGGVRIFN